jgi:hypothetical protein
MTDSRFASAFPFRGEPFFFTRLASCQTQKIQKIYTTSMEEAVSREMRGFEPGTQSIEKPTWHVEESQRD